MSRSRIRALAACVLAAGACLQGSGAGAVAASVPTLMDPPLSLSWWYSPKPTGPGTIVAVRRSRDRIRYYDNWAPCFKGRLIRPKVYKGGGLNMNAFYSKQRMKIWVADEKLRVKRAFVGYERLSEVDALSYKSISAARASRLLNDRGLSEIFLKCK